MLLKAIGTLSLGMYVVTGLEAVLLGSLMVFGWSVLLDDPEENLCLMYMLIPVMAVFRPANSSWSYGIMLFLLAGVVHLFKRARWMRFRPWTLIGVMAILIIEWSHVGLNPIWMVPYVRWALIFLYGAVLFLDEEFSPRIDRMVAYLITGIALSVLCGLVMDLPRATIRDAGIDFGRFSGGAGDANALAMVCALAVSHLVGSYVAGRHARIGWIPLTLGCLGVGLATFSRTFILSMIVVVLLLLLSNLFKPGKKILVLMGIVAVVLILGILFSGDLLAVLYKGQLVRLSEIAQGAEIGGSRNQVWQDYLQKMDGHGWAVWFGNGALTYMDVLEMELGAHNTLLELYLSWGVVGGVILFVVIGSFFRVEMRRCGVNRIQLLGLMPLAVMFIFFMTLQSLSKYSTLFLLGLAFKSSCASMHPWKDGGDENA